MMAGKELQGIHMADNWTSYMAAVEGPYAGRDYGMKRRSS